MRLKRLQGTMNKKITKQHYLLERIELDNLVANIRANNNICLLEKRVLYNMGLVVTRYDTACRRRLSL